VNNTVEGIRTFLKSSASCEDVSTKKTAFYGEVHNVTKQNKKKMK
jgi:hypothetical protein